MKLLSCVCRALNLMFCVDRNEIGFNWGVHSVVEHKFNSTSNDSATWPVGFLISHFPQSYLHLRKLLFVFSL